MIGGYKAPPGSAFKYTHASIVHGDAHKLLHKAEDAALP
jgi:hypothetical protein